MGRQGQELHPFRWTARRVEGAGTLGKSEGRIGRTVPVIPSALPPGPDGPHGKWTPDGGAGIMRAGPTEAALSLT